MKDDGKRRLSGMPSQEDISPAKNTRRLPAKYMSDESVSALSIPELVDLLKRIAEEIEIRVMQNAN